MAESFGRVIEMFVEKRKFEGSDFTILFDVPFDDGGDANIAEIKIYNLKDDTINGLKRDSRVILNAGYTGDVGAVLLGIVKEVKTEWSGVDRITTMQVLDGTEAWFSLQIQKTYAKNVKAQSILDDIVKMTGLQIGAIKLPKNHVYKSGKTVKGKLRQIIKDIARDCGAKAHTTRGKIFIRPKDEGDTIGFLLDTEHGLISSPTPIEKEVEIKSTKPGKKDKKGKPTTVKVTTKKKVNGWSVKCLLNHKITTDALIKINSKTANGTFRVESGKHNGSAYETEMEVYPV